MTGRILAVIVCYNPDVRALGQSIAALTGQDCDVLLVDNASDNLPQLSSLSESVTRCRVLSLDDNLGLGTAHNRGIKEAQDGQYSYVLLLDQDSVPLDNMVRNLVSAHIEKSKTEQLCAVGSTYLNVDNGSESFFVRFGALKFRRQYCGERDSAGCIQADFLISSGSLIALEAFDDIGLMDESLFIDHVDTEWFLRARSKQYKAFGVCDAFMQHGLGETTHQISLGGRQRNVPQHKPFRYYYIFRNSVLLYKRGYSSGVWIWNDVQRLVMIMLMFGLLKAPRRQNLKMMCKGIWHGLRGVSGAVNV